ncbi:MAG: hypothetical protein GY780_05525 [bacterium]|nr:hypothetical protein [bacterium]
MAFSPRKALSIATALILGQVLVSGCFPEPADRTQAFESLARWEDRRHAPEDSLLAMIKNDDAHVRLRAIRSAGLIGNRNVVPAMIDALEDPSETVARQSTYSLGLMADEAATGAIEAILNHPGNRLHLEAALALAHLPNHGTGLLKATESEDAAVAAAAWDGLRNVADQTDSTALTQAIIRDLNGTPTDVLWRVLRCAERIPSPKLISHISAHIRSQNLQVRVHAYRALSRQGEIESLKATLMGCANEEKTGTRAHQRTLVAACNALGMLAEPGLKTGSTLSPELQNLLTETLISSAGHPNPHLAATALQAMKRCADYFELPLEAAQQESLLPVWRIRLGRAAHSHVVSEHHSVSSIAIEAWASLRGTGCANELVELLNSQPTPSNRIAILRALSRHSTDAYEILADHSTPDNNHLIRLGALEGLNQWALRPENIADRARIVHDLASAACDPDFVVAATALGFLEEFPETLSFLVMLEAWQTQYTEGTPEVKRTILRTLKSYGPDLANIESGKIHTESADSLRADMGELLGQAFDSPDLRIRLEARETALTTQLLPSHLIPTTGSLRATMPAFERHASQPEVALPYQAPVVICKTNRGSFEIELNGQIAPNTCAMFCDLIQSGYYNNLTFHRVVADFVAQGGDPRGDGWGGPGYTIRSEWSPMPYERGTVGIAHDGKDTGGSQFFIALSEQPHLNGRYSVFGKVVAGMDVVDNLEVGDSFSFDFKK